MQKWQITYRLVEVPFKGDRPNQTMILARDELSRRDPEFMARALFRRMERSLPKGQSYLFISAKRIP